MHLPPYCSLIPGWCHATNSGGDSQMFCSPPPKTHHCRDTPKVIHADVSYYFANWISVFVQEMHVCFLNWNEEMMSFVCKRKITDHKRSSICRWLLSHPNMSPSSVTNKPVFIWKTDVCSSVAQLSYSFVDPFPMCLKHFIGIIFIEVVVVKTLKILWQYCFQPDIQ